MGGVFVLTCIRFLSVRLIDELFGLFGLFTLAVDAFENELLPFDVDIIVVVSGLYEYNGYVVALQDTGGTGGFDEFDVFTLFELLLLVVELVVFVKLKLIVLLLLLFVDEPNLIVKKN